MRGCSDKMTTKSGKSGVDLQEFKKMVLCYEKARKEGLTPKNPELEEFLVALKREESTRDNLVLPGANVGDTRPCSQEITPQPYFVVKTSDKCQKKVFINICGSLKIAAPGDWDKGVPVELEEAFSSMGDEDENTQNIRFSLSCSNPRDSLDKNGKPCLVYDVVYNAHVLDYAMRYKRLKTFLVEMAISWIGQKYKCELNYDFKLPNAKYKGAFVGKHYIRAVPEPLISEIPDLGPSFPLKLDSDSSKSLREPTSMLLQQTSSPEGTQASTSSPVASKKVSNSSTLPVIQQTDSAMCSNLPPTDETHVVLLQSPPLQSGMQLINNSSQVPMDVPIANKPQLMSQISSSVENLSSDSFQNEEASPLNPQLENYLTIINPTSADYAGLPQTRMEYDGHPIDRANILVNFGSLVEMGDISLHATHTRIYIQAKSFQPLEIPLVFPTLPRDINATLNSCEGVLRVMLPFFSYTELFNKSC